MLPLLALGCNDKTTPPDPETPATHTLIMYMVGSNANMSYYLKSNINDVYTSVTNTFPDWGKIFIYYHGLDDRLGIAECTLWEVLPPTENGAMPTLKVHEEYSTDRASTSAEAINAVISKVKSIAKTEVYGMSFSGHSTGWFPADISPDKQKSPGVISFAGEHDFGRNEDTMTRAFGPTIKGEWGDFSDIVEGVKGAGLEYIMFDMCFMSSAEVLYDLRNSAKYILATPTEILITGFPYRKVIPVLFSKKTDYPIVERLTDIGEAVVDYYESGSAGYEDKNLWAASMTLVETSKIDAMAQAVKNIIGSADKTFDDTKAGDISYIQYLELIPDHAFFDLRDYMSKICSDQTLLSQLDTALDDMIIGEHWHTSSIYSGYGDTGTVPMQRVCGISSYIPRNAYPLTKEAYLNTAWAKFTRP